MLGKEFRLKRSFFVWVGTVSSLFVVLLVFIHYRFGDAMSFPILAARFERLFSDFSEVLTFSVSSSPYECYKTSYPPLAILLFRPIGFLCSASAKTSHADFLASPVYIGVYTAYFVSGVALVCLAFKKLVGKFCDSKAFLHSCLLFGFSGGILHSFFRGNVIITALLFTMLFLAFKDSENKVLRELSLICLALAGAIKIYPLIFGAFLLNKKRFIDSLKVGVYFVLLFVLPFLAFDGGFENIRLFWENMTTFQYGQERLYQLSNMSVSGLILKLFSLFEQTPTVVFLAEVLSKSCMILAFILCAFVAVFTKNNIRRALACAVAVCIIPSVSYYYVTVFMVIPLAYYFRYPTVEDDTHRATLSDVLHGRASLAQIKDVAFWCSVLMISMAVQVPLRFALGTALYIVVLVLGMAFSEVRILFNTKKGRSLTN